MLCLGVKSGHGDGGKTRAKELYEQTLLMLDVHSTCIDCALQLMNPWSHLVLLEMTNFKKVDSLGFHIFFVEIKLCTFTYLPNRS